MLEQYFCQRKVNKSNTSIELQSSVFQPMVLHSAHTHCKVHSSRDYQPQPTDVEMAM